MKVCETYDGGGCFLSKYRRAAKIDKNQPGIVKALRDIPGVSVAVGHDDILVGYRGRTYWYEIKSGNKLDRYGRVTMDGIKKSQIDLMRDWRGHYRIVSSVDEIINELLGKRSI